ncbi:MAG: hypothetical protein ACYC6R_01650 [Anaerolineales bacterium]
MMNKKPADNAKKKNPYSKSLKVGIENLKEEIQLALQWDRPSILFAIHSSKAGLIKSKQALEKEILHLNKKVKRLEVDDNLIRALRATTDRGNIVFFISGFEDTNDNSKDSVYRLLNMQREFFVENLIRAVFWLTKEEAGKLPHAAPDFWAFRHRVVEFAPTRDPK